MTERAPVSTPEVTSTNPEKEALYEQLRESADTVIKYIKENEGTPEAEAMKLQVKALVERIETAVAPTPAPAPAEAVTPSTPEAVTPAPAAPTPEAAPSVSVAPVTPDATPSAPAADTGIRFDDGRPLFRDEVKPEATPEATSTPESSEGSRRGAGRGLLSLVGFKGRSKEGASEASGSTAAPHDKTVLLPRVTPEEAAKASAEATGEKESKPADAEAKTPAAEKEALTDRPSFGIKTNVIRRYGEMLHDLGKGEEEFTFTPGFIVPIMGHRVGKGEGGAGAFVSPEVAEKGREGLSKMDKYKLSQQEYVAGLFGYKIINKEIHPSSYIAKGDFVPPKLSELPEVEFEGGAIKAEGKVLNSLDANTLLAARFVADNEPLQKNIDSLFEDASKQLNENGTYAMRLDDNRSEAEQTAFLTQLTWANGFGRSKFKKETRDDGDYIVVEASDSLPGFPRPKKPEATAA